MESKTKHRILGMVVVAGLAVLAYPFIQGSSNITKEQVSVKAPPFPDQAIQVTVNDESSAVMPPDMSSSTSTDSALPNASSPELPVSSDNPDNQDDAHTVNIATPQPEVSAPIMKPSPDVVESPKPEASAPATAAPAEPEETDKPSPAPSPSSLNSTNENTTPLTDKISTKHKNKMAATKPKSSTAAPVLLSKLTSAAAIKANKHKPINNNGLLQLKQAAYVIQLGSFKNKTNALRLVNRLRAQGYRAFIQHAVVASGENTRVFVGPEHKQASARIVASELENKMKLHGIVISYKPFTL